MKLKKINPLYFTDTKGVTIEISTKTLLADDFFEGGFPGG